ncbi:hypothetical protein [Salinibacter sp. 10B]|uniref:hypothetical protein n=1 Tax=Salinibacter sp. 10B TaxID=1923971 RepID=UPI0011B00BDB|nr:hypothetical protein [Salinibacter sp. 10B]
MSDSTRRYRQYVGLALVIITYVGGIIGWSWAAVTVEPTPTAPDEAYTRVEPLPSSEPVVGQ